MSEQATTADPRTDAGGPAGASVPNTETDAEELLIRGDCWARLGIWRKTEATPFFWLKKFTRKREMFGIS